MERIINVKVEKLPEGMYLATSDEICSTLHRVNILHLFLFHSNSERIILRIFINVKRF